VPLSLQTKSTSQNYQNLFQVKPGELAEVLSTLDSEIFQQIPICEYLYWTYQQDPKLKETQTTHLAKYVQRFNATGYWVTLELLNVRLTFDQRLKLLGKFIKTAKKCEQMNNFNTLMAILSGLNHSSVQRLSQLWAVKKNSFFLEKQRRDFVEN
jgi:hypothetical protein